jgi:RNA polymerase sigma-70 factor (ECF subfamily)
VTDADLVEAFRRGDESAFRRLYADYGRLVHAVAYRVLGERSLAEEATQQTFVRAWEHATSFEVGRDLAPWLVTIAKRIAIDVWRRERHRNHQPLDDLANVESPAGSDAVEDVWSIRAALGELSGDARALLRMQYYEGFSQQDVADHLGIPVGTVKSRTHAAQTRLAGALRHAGVLPPKASVPSPNRDKR